jgi:hypothetical protein
VACTNFSTFRLQALLLLQLREKRMPAAGGRVREDASRCVSVGSVGSWGRHRGERGELCAHAVAVVGSFTDAQCLAALLASGDLTRFRQRLEEHAMSCVTLGVRDGLDVVVCTIDNRQLASDAEDHCLYRVEIEAVGAGIHNVHATVDQSAEQTTTDDKVLGFFAGTVLGGLTSIDLAPFVRSTLNSGGIIDSLGLHVAVGGPPRQRTLDVILLGPRST